MYSRTFSEIPNCLPFKVNHDKRNWYKFPITLETNGVTYNAISIPNDNSHTIDISLFDADEIVSIDMDILLSLWKEMKKAAH